MPRAKVDFAGNGHQGQTHECLQAQAAPKGTAAKPEPADDNEELDIDISDDDAAAPGADGEGSEVEEDWGLWD